MNKKDPPRYMGGGQIDYILGGREYGAPNPVDQLEMYCRGTMG